MTIVGHTWDFRGFWYLYHSVCYVFTKLLHPLVKRWRRTGLRCVVYIVDGICAARSRVECSAAEEIVLSDLGKAGFILSTENVLDPVQKGNWLGCVIDLCVGSFFVPSEKISRLQSNVASLTLHGQFVCVHFAVLLAKLFQRALQLA